MQNAVSEAAQNSGVFFPRPGAILCLEIDTQAQSCVNFDFTIADQTRIPLHLSLRRDAGLVVVNQFTARGWHREIAFRRALTGPVQDIELAFGRDLLGKLTVGLWLNGAPLARLDAYPRPDRAGPKRLRRGFPALGRIARMTWPAGLRSMRWLHPDRALTPTLTERLELVWNTAGQAALLDLHDDEPPVAFLPLPGAGSQASRSLQIARLPGRIWRETDGGVAHVTLQMAGQTVKVPIDTRMVLEQLHCPAALWQMQNDPLIRLHMLEHVQHGGLWPRLSGPAREILGATARRLGMPGFEAPIPTLASPHIVARSLRNASRTCDAFHARVASTRAHSPALLLGDLISEDRLPPAEVRQLVLMLSEWFCLHGDPMELATLAAGHGVSDWANRSDAWASIAGLPMLWAQGNWSAIEATLRGYPRQSSHWLVTPALGWVATALADRTPDLQGALLPEARRVALMTALLELVADLAPSYWAQTRCLRVIAGVLDILAELPLLPDWCSDWYVELCLRAFGLSPEFWETFAARPRLTDQPALAQAAQGFAALQNALASGKEALLWDAARPFLLRKSAGHEMLRRVILSPPAPSSSYGRRPDLAGLSQVLSRHETEETALRWLAFPRSAETRAEIALQPGEPLHKAACDGLRSAATAIPRPALAQAGLRLGRHVHHSLAQLRKMGTLGAQPSRDLQLMALALTIRDAGFIGVPALLAVAEAASRQGATALARTLCRALRAALEHCATDDPAAAQAPRLALARFRDCCPDASLRALLAPWLDAASAGPASEDPVAAHLRAASNPFADTLVALISCHANLETRAKDCRAAWGEDLARLGIPLVTVVGRRGDQTEGMAVEFNGSLLQLDVPDSYEALPQKSLALAQWVQRHTGFSRLLKLDDDCLLNAKAYFDDPAFLAHPYYGRPLYRAPGTMDRGWHIARSRSRRGRLEFDKSPEPSCYADGSTGYMLARPALEALEAARLSPRGRALEQASFMEDKLVGDLLSLSGITVSGQNYDVAVFRRSAEGLGPLAQYENSFLPFLGAPVKLAHLDSGGAVLEQARRSMETPWPNPMKIWPSMVRAQTGWARNALDLVTPPDRLDQARQADVAVVSVMRNEGFMLRHFLEHYRRLGVGAFLVVDNGSDDGTLEELVAQSDVSVFVTDTPYSLSTYGVQWQEALLAQFRIGRWSLVADADELVFWQTPGSDGRIGGDLPRLMARPEFANAEAVRLLMLDLYPAGRLSEAQFTGAPFLEAGHIDRAPLCRNWQGRGPWSNSETLTSALRHRLMAELGAPARANLFVAQKYALLKYHPLMRLSAGLHYITGARVAARDLAFGHFKYHAAFLAKAEAEVARGQHFNNAEEYRAYLRLRAEARDTLFSAAHSVPLSHCPTVRNLCRSYNAPKPNSGGIRSQSSSTRSAMICASAGAMAKPILNPPLNT